jgi:outer membrane protein TolC
VLTAFQEVEDNLVAAASLEEQIVLQSDALKAAERNLEISNNQYRAGTVSYLNVVTAQATALGSERSLLDLRNRRLNATAVLLKNLGGRWEPEKP